MGVNENASCAFQCMCVCVCVRARKSPVRFMLLHISDLILLMFDDKFLQGDSGFLAACRHEFQSLTSFK